MDRDSHGEIWAVAYGTSGRYEVSTFGRVRNAKTQKILSTQDKHGYRKLNLHVDGKLIHKYVHRLVAETFIANPDNKPQVNHIDGIHDNNHIENLEWVTADENHQHAIDNDLAKKARYAGHRSRKALLSKAEIITKQNLDELIIQAESRNTTVYGLYKLQESMIEKYKSEIRSIKHEMTKHQRLAESCVASAKDAYEEYQEKSKQFIGMDDPELQIGKKRNYLEIIGYAKDKDNHTRLVCRCDCGTIKVENAWFWKNDKVKSCGCKHDELARQSSAIGEYNKEKYTALYEKWKRNYRTDLWYDGWKEYEPFKRWANENGYKDGMYLHRKDIAKPFSPDNCFIKDKPQNTGNNKPIKRYECNGEMLTRQEMAEKYNMLESTIGYRLKRGMTASEAVNTPLLPQGRTRKLK